MDQASLLTVLRTTGLPIAYHHFKTPPKPPYVVYLRVADSNIASDFAVHGKFKTYQVELYTAKKDLASEKIVEDVLKTINSEYDTSETFIESEGLYQVVYQITVIERG